MTAELQDVCGVVATNELVFVGIAAFLVGLFTMLAGIFVFAGLYYRFGP